MERRRNERQGNRLGLKCETVSHFSSPDKLKLELQLMRIACRPDWMQFLHSRLKY
jgi:hypothetical protein